MKVATTGLILISLLVLSTQAPALEQERTWDGAAVSSRSGDAPFDPTLAEIQANIFTPSCALSFCHGAALSAGLDLRDGTAYSAIVNVPANEFDSWFRIEPFNPDESFLICKLEACPNLVGQQMPLIGGPLPQNYIDVIRAWVNRGAPETEGVAVEPASWGRVKSQYR